MIRALAYMLVALVVTTIVHAYLHRRLIADTALPPRWRRVARVALAIAAALLPAGMAALLAMRTAPRALQTPIMWCAFVWSGLLSFLLPLLFVSEAARVLPASPERRRVMARIIALTSGGISAILGGVATVAARRPLVVTRVRARLPRLDESMRGYKIVQISDLHVSATIGRDLVEAVVARVNALSPDLVAVTGDLVDGSVEELGPLVASLAQLRARDGVYFVTGNHEYLSGASEWVAFVATLGMRVLRNEHVAIGGARGFDLIGIDDESGAPDLAGALAGRDRSRASVLLAHRPDVVAEAARAGIGLQLSGHTHGGQIAPLGWTLERLRQPYVFGLYEIGETLLYVTSGAGYWGPPMRLATRAEIVCLDLDSVTPPVAEEAPPTGRRGRARRRRTARRAPSRRRAKL
jgi:predicted MPP superfamily phosphohydrolase